MKKLSIDVMLRGGAKFYCTLKYEYNPLFKIDLEDVIRFVFERLPSLKDRDDVQLVIDKV
ncbi:MAG: hypothetical protein J6M63_02635 [Pseudobutyrivibrio sp.]|nr:hypothetical protein [Pseudobutyrivibrio sp.]